MNFAQKMKSYRQKNNWTQQEVAGRLDVSRKTISSWENSRSYPDIFMLVQISDLYRVSLDDLLREDHEMIDNYKQEHEMNKKEQRFFIVSYGVNVIISIMAVLHFSLVNIPIINKFAGVIALALIFNTWVLCNYINWKSLKMKYGFYTCWLVLTIMEFRLTLSTLDGNIHYQLGYELGKLTGSILVSFCITATIWLYPQFKTKISQ
ncbi:MAG: helix-turn-helix domain-containing protein [Limosilactobacillus sp.]|uniref:helix-turn-helix domain-containing protein n=1 Tax=Limosilactobacillus sp. TaxID=2773925 RepID=UPI0025BAA251|nr:helix-turn-helix transcriptional regulator [Limosilactobacillus sp.]MCI1975292.1 helix-turn-helix domain-containing protein [Limosilactobacillus sp.]MCI2030402.1 helix-turn-helix domain-containing protein [Limosilactobacillus sp.]